MLWTLIRSPLYQSWWLLKELIIWWWLPNPKYWFIFCTYYNVSNINMLPSYVNTLVTFIATLVFFIEFNFLNLIYLRQAIIDKIYNLNIKNIWLYLLFSSFKRHFLEAYWMEMIWIVNDRLQRHTFFHEQCVTLKNIVTSSIYFFQFFFSWVNTMQQKYIDFS
jgi:hypothetical protein